MRIMTLLACMFATAMAYGQERVKVPDKIIKELQWMVGTWKVEGGSIENKVDGTWSARWSPGKHCLMRQSSHKAGNQTLVGIGVIGWDGATERIVEQVFFSNNDSALLRWKVLPSGNWEGDVTGLQNGVKFERQAKITRKGPNESVYEEMTEGKTTCEVVLRKVKQSAGKPPETKVPEAAMKELQYRVGKWESVGYVDGKKIEELGYETTEWVPGRPAIRIAGSFVEEGVTINAGGLVGWDAEKKQTRRTLVYLGRRQRNVLLQPGQGKGCLGGHVHLELPGRAQVHGAISSGQEKQQRVGVERFLRGWRYQAYLENHQPQGSVNCRVVAKSGRRQSRRWGRIGTNPDRCQLPSARGGRDVRPADFDSKPRMGLATG